MIRIFLGFALAVLGCVCSAQENAQPEPVTLVPGPNPISLGRHVQFMRDDSGKLTLDDVRFPALARQFTPGDTDSFNQGFTQDAYWYRVTLRNPAGQNSQSSDWVLELQVPVLDYVDIHVTRRDGSTQAILTGDQRPAPAEQLAHHNFAVPLRITPGEAVTLHLRVQTDGGHLVRLDLWPARAFQVKATEENLRFGVFYGIMLVMALYNLIICAWIRDRAYLYYVLYIFSATSTALIFNGYAREYCAPLLAGALLWVITATALFGSLATFFCDPVFTRVHGNSPAPTTG